MEMVKSFFGSLFNHFFYGYLSLTLNFIMLVISILPILNSFHIYRSFVEINKKNNAFLKARAIEK